MGLERPTTIQPTALIAEDEPLLAVARQAQPGRVWPELQMVALAGDGASAVTLALQLQPDVLLFDIQLCRCRPQAMNT